MVAEEKEIIVENILLVVEFFVVFVVLFLQEDVGHQELKMKKEHGSVCHQLKKV